MTRKRAIAAGFTDYTGVGMDDILSHLKDWKANTDNTISLLEKHLAAVRENTERLDEPNEIESFISYFIDLFRRYSADFQRLLDELPSSVEQRHIDIIRQICDSSQHEDKLCVMFKQDHISRALKDESLRAPLIDRIYGDTRDMIVDYLDLDNLVHRLKAFVGMKQTVTDRLNPKSSAPSRAAWIGFAGAVIAALILGLMTLLKTEEKHGAQTVTGNQSPGIAVNGNANPITINYGTINVMQTNTVPLLEEEQNATHVESSTLKNELTLIRAELANLQRKTNIQNERIETFMCDDKERVFLAQKPDGAVVIYFLLQDVPIAGTMRVRYGNAPSLPSSLWHTNNVASTIVALSEPQPSALLMAPFTISYISDETIDTRWNIRVSNNRQVIVDDTSFTPDAEYFTLQNNISQSGHPD